MQQWVADGPDPGPARQLPAHRARRQGLTAYRPEPDRLRRHRGRVLLAAGGRRRAGTRLPVRARTSPARWRSCTTSRTRPGSKVDYLHLSPRTIARIFMGDICNWNDPAITADNKGLVLPDQPDHRRLPRRPVRHHRRSSTTSCQHTDARHLRPVGGASNQLPTNVRIIQLDSSPSFARQDPGPQRLRPDRRSTSPAASGMWSIGYDEFGYAMTYNVADGLGAERVGGQWVLPYAAEHLGRARGGQAAPRPEPGPLGRVRQPQPARLSRSRPTATSSPSARRRPIGRPARATYSQPGHHRDAGQVDALHRLRRPGQHGRHRLLAVAAQPVPGDRQLDRPHEGRRRPETLTAANCANPRFRGELGADSGAPPDPIKNVVSLATKGGTANGSSSAAGPAASGPAERGGCLGCGRLDPFGWRGQHRLA